MRKLVLILAATATLQTAYAQRSNVESAAVYLRNLEMVDAKKAIDEAATHDDTKDDPKMWYYRTAIYDTILRNKAYSALVDNNTVEQFVLAAKGCVTSDTKKRYDWYCGSQAIIQAAFDAYNAGWTALQAKDYTKTIKFFEYVTATIPLDKDGQLKKNNLTERAIYDAIYRSAYVDQEYDIARTYSKKLIDMDYQSPIVYYINAETYLINGDTAKGLEVVELGRNRFPTDKDLINYELNIYLNQGKQSILLSKINEALTNNPDNATLNYVRGNIYDKYASECLSNARKAADEAEKADKKAKAEKVPANKTKFQNQAKNLRAKSDSLYKAMLTNANLAETNYKKTVELNPDNMDGYYALGALLNNYENVLLVNKMNAVTGATQAEYDNKYEVLRKQQLELLNKSLKYFNDALAIVETMPESDENLKAEKKRNTILIYESLKSLYANMNDEAKFMETKKKLDELE